MLRPAALVLCLVVSAITTFANELTPTPIGGAVESFTLDNCYGKPVSLSDFADRKLVVIAFLGTECPLAEKYGPRLNTLHERFGDDLIILGLNANTQDSLTEIAAFVRNHEIKFPMLKDINNQVADAMGAERIPEVFLLDEARTVRYHGRIDDQYGVGYSRARTVKSDLAVAIEELLAGKSVTVPETEAVGCYIGRVNDRRPTGEITFHKHIAPILNNRCVSCHREQELAPFTLTSYDDVLGWEDTILEVIDNGRMPPWFAEPGHMAFANDASLPVEEKRLIETWVENGMPEGDPADAPPAPKFAVGWKIPKPDQVIYMNENKDQTKGKPFTVPAEGVVDYQRFVVDPKWSEDKYIYAAEARPDNRGVVHHILVYVIPPGARRMDLRQVLVGYAPGGLPIHYKDGTALKIAAGSKLLFEMHYTPNGREQTDLSYVGVSFMDKSDVKTLAQGRIAINPRLNIEPFKKDQEVKAEYEVRDDEWLISMTPHMHLRGQAFKYTAHLPGDPNPEGKTLLNIPAYDFNWQLKYILKEPFFLPKGTVIKCRALYDNSKDNLSNPAPENWVRWGDQTDEEMMIGFMNTLPAE